MLVATNSTRVRHKVLQEELTKILLQKISATQPQLIGVVYVVAVHILK